MQLFGVVLGRLGVLCSVKGSDLQMDPAAAVWSLLLASLVPAGCFSHATHLLSNSFSLESFSLSHAHSRAFVEIPAAQQSEYQPETQEGSNISGAKEKTVIFHPKSRSGQRQAVGCADADGPSRGGARCGLELEALSPLSLLCRCLLQTWKPRFLLGSLLPREGGLLLRSPGCRRGRFLPCLFLWGESSCKNAGGGGKEDGSGSSPSWPFVSVPLGALSIPLFPSDICSAAASLKHRTFNP